MCCIFEALKPSSSVCRHLGRCVSSVNNVGIGSGESGAIILSSLKQCKHFIGRCYLHLCSKLHKMAFLKKEELSAVLWAER